MGTLGLYRAAEITADDAERTAAIMERGVRRFPDDGVLVWRTGAVLAFELPHLYEGQPDRQRRARERAMPYLIRATELGAAPPYMMIANASLLERLGRAEEAAAHLEEMYAVTGDVEMRAEMLTLIRALRSEVFASGFADANQSFEDRWGREMPYAPAALYDLVGPVPIVDTTAVLRDGFGAHVLPETIDLGEATSPPEVATPR
jgi:hypothetical protein